MHPGKRIAVRRRAQLVLGLGFMITTAVEAADESVEAAGKMRFMESCAVCHGPQATGDGPYASLLNKSRQI